METRMTINLEEVHVFETKLASVFGMGEDKELLCVVRYDPTDGESSCYYQVMNHGKSVRVSISLATAIEKYLSI